MIKRSDLEPLIVGEWLKRPEDKRTELDVVSFYNELRSNRPELLSFKTVDDKYQVLKSILRNYIQKRE